MRFALLCEVLLFSLRRRLYVLHLALFTFAERWAWARSSYGHRRAIF